MTKDLAPVAFFAFNRPMHTTTTLAALSACDQALNTTLHIFIDGERKEADRTLVAEVTEIAYSAVGFRNVYVHKASRNLGLYTAITEGVSQILSRADRIIVVEDDILVAPFFLKYMNQALERYQDCSSVGSIHAFSHAIEGLPDYFFLRGGDCWGWATWKDRWALFEPDASLLLKSLVTGGHLRDFCLSHGSDSLLHLVRRKQGRNASWAILWHASLFLANRLTLHPGRSFVQNIGNDGSGTHSDLNSYPAHLISAYHDLPQLQITEDRKAARRVGAYMDRGGERDFSKSRRLAKRIYAYLLAQASSRFC